MRILVTGATGFIGANFVKIARTAGHEIACMGRHSPTGEARFFAVDLSTGEGLGAIPFADFDAVVHLAAAGVKTASRMWPECVQVNVVGTRRLLDRIASSPARPLVWLGQTFYEQEAAAFPQLLDNPYIATKHAGSELAREWARTYGGAIVFGKLYQVYGPDDNSGNLLNYAARQLLRSEPATFGSGAGRRDWIFVDDVSEGILACLSAGGAKTQTFELGTGRLTAIREVILKMTERAGVSPSLLRFDPARDRNDLTIAARAIRPPPNWVPRVALDEGLQHILTAQSRLTGGLK